MSASMPSSLGSVHLNRKDNDRISFGDPQALGLAIRLAGPAALLIQSGSESAFLSARRAA